MRITLNIAAISLIFISFSAHSQSRATYNLIDTHPPEVLNPLPRFDWDLSLQLFAQQPIVAGSTYTDQGRKSAQRLMNSRDDTGVCLSRILQDFAKLVGVPLSQLIEDFSALQDVPLDRNPEFAEFLKSNRSPVKLKFLADSSSRGGKKIEMTLLLPEEKIEETIVVAEAREPNQNFSASSCQSFRRSFEALRQRVEKRKSPQGTERYLKENTTPAHKP